MTDFYSFVRLSNVHLSVLLRYNARLNGFNLGHLIQSEHIAIFSHSSYK